ncbi:MAG: PAS domain S-box protein [Candidatus Thorarchaeota archaeon]|nr:PAS domain S-box protein [Candidatus Thorarchaeota archaeon]
MRVGTYVGEEMTDALNPLGLADIDRTQFRDTAESIPVAILEIDLEYNVLFANAFARTLLQLTDEHIISGINLNDIVLSSQIGSVTEGLRRLTEDAKPISIGIRVKRRDGAELATETTARLITHNGVPVGYTSYSVDMTRRLAIEERIRKQEGLFQTLLDQSSFIGLLIVNDMFLFEYANDRLCQILDRTRGEILGSDFRKFLAPESIELVSNRYIRRQRGEAVENVYSFKIIRPDGTLRLVELSASTIVSGNNSIKTVSQMRDITDESEQRTALIESEHRHRTLIETMDSGLCVDDEQGICRLANKALCEILGYDDVDELIGHPIAMWVHGWTKSIVDEKVAERKLGKHEQYELDLIHKSGELIPAIVHASPWFDSSNNYLGSFAVFTDVSELKRAEAEARFLLDLLLHDIGNQLQLILAGADLLDGESTPDQVDNARRYVLDGASRCIELISNVRRAEEAKSEPLVEIDLVYILQTQIRLFSGQYGINPEVTDLPDQLIVRADRALGHLFWNLMENTVKHNPRSDKRIWIFGKKENRHFSVHISDNGPGLDETQKTRLFDPTRRSSGVGIHLVRRLARKYDSPLRVLDRVKGHSEEGLEVEIRFLIGE